jgi:serine/threonine protein phosphatase PrpC
MKCPNCNEESSEGATFCEGCGSTLAPSAAGGSKDPKIECQQCHAGPGCIDGEGFCTSCGARRTASPRDHFHQVITAQTAGVSDIGLKHHENQDYMALGASSGKVALVVCDGVSNSQNSMAGSKAASEAARDRIIAEIAAGDGDPDEVLKLAMNDAQSAICKVPFTPVASDSDLPPAQATIVGALVVGRRITVGWVGDSRAYWVNRKVARQLTIDDSWYNYAVAPLPEGLGMSPADASKHKLSHALLQSLGAANDGKNPGVAPNARTLNLTESGVLLVTTDGFWNYVKNEDHLVKLVNQLPRDTDALTLANHLVNFARQAGGHDNITVVAAIFS